MTEIQTSTRTTQVAFALPDTGAAASEAVAAAQGYCARKMHIADPDQVIELLRARNVEARGYFDYGLARELAEHIGALDAEVHGVYLHDPENAPEDALPGDKSPTLIHILVWAQRRTGALKSLLSALERAVLAQVNDLLETPDQAFLLDLQVVDDSEVNARTGLGAMLSSVHNRPLMVWSR